MLQTLRRQCVLRCASPGLLLALLLSWQQPAAADVGSCEVFPPDNVWNTPIDTLPVAPKSSVYIQVEGPDAPLHPDFGTVYNGAPNGIPYVVVPAPQPLVPIILQPYGDEADPGPYPIPPDAPIEGGANSTGDRHVLVVQEGSCTLYELFRAFPRSNGSWQGFGAVFELTDNGPLRPAGNTSADAAGLPILPGLVKYEEVQAALQGDGIIHHALRFTVPYTRQAYVWPARHWASHFTNPDYPPMGQRFRLKASVDIDYYPGTNTPVSPINKVILRTLKKYGMFIADNGSAWFLSGAPDPRWSDDDLHRLTYYRAAQFEAVDASGLMVDPDSGQAATPPPCSTLPAKPTLLSPMINGTVATSQVPLDWDNTSCATSFRVIVRQDSSTGRVVAQGTNLTASRYTTPALAAGHTYFWQVRACNSVGCYSSAWGKFVVHIP